MNSDYLDCLHDHDHVDFDVYFVDNFIKFHKIYNFT